MLLALLTATLTFVAALRLGQWMVRERAGALVTLQLTRAALNAGISLLLVAWLLWAAEGRVIGHFIATFVVALIAAHSLLRDRLIRFDCNSEQVWDALRFGVPLIPHVAGMFLLGAVDRIVINDRLGLAEVGVYTVAVQLAMGLSLLFAAFNKAYVPWLYSRLKRGSEDEKREIVRLTYLYFIGCLILAGAVWLIGPTIAALLAGPQYAEAGAVIGWLALGQAFFGMYLMVTNYIFYSKRTGALAATTLVSGMINVLVMVMLTGFLGVKGAAIAFAFALFLRFLMTWAVAARRHPMPWLAPNWSQMMAR